MNKSFQNKVDEFKLGPPDININKMFIESSGLETSFTLNHVKIPMNENKTKKSIFSP
jgi:hypothetical protein